MSFDIRIYHHFIREHEDRTERKLDKILTLLTLIQREEVEMSVELDALTVQVTANEDVEKSAILLIQGIADQLTAIKDDPVKISELSASLKISADNLAAAITANTPAPPVGP